MIEILTNAVFRDPRITAAEDEVPGGANADLAGYMTRQDELAVIPSYVDLFAVSVTSYVLQSPETITKGVAVYSPACV